MQPSQPPRYHHSPRQPIRLNTKPKSHPIECLYRNDTLHPQIIRISNLPNLHWEKVVLPGQCATFQTLSTAELEVISGPVTTLIADRIPCKALSLRSLKSSQSRLISQLTSPQSPQASKC